MLHRARPATGSPPSRRAVRRPGIDGLRGGLVGGAVVVLAVAAHGWADGGYPGSATLALLLLSAAATGTFASMLPSTGGARGRTGVLAALGGGQAVSHITLSLLPTHRPGETSCGSGLSGLISVFPSSWMTLAHTLATVVCAVLIVAVERLYAAVSRSVRAVTTRPRPPVDLATPRWRTSARQPWQQWRAGALGSRAPPVLA
ncbi:hypothetical protein C5E45_06560 [Nocardia nova]|uniref:Uncharacterized protein n=1 Tax=Nocardia nova TaxID=37330 RepID=A0A2S6AV20_9NOCA|nr:hypothetical protein [Nocardia nova]PPJ22453.1 hypothetical protein C5E41_27130 [Nocardia nova]PPJ39127.1 hypothetical protein C5E45_06560 [Nocardia nova]